MEAWTEAIGSAAALLTTIAFVPQVLKIWRTGSTEDISLAMFAMFCAGLVMWLVYGVLLLKWPIILANLVTLGLAGAVLAMKIRDLRNKKTH